MCYPLYVTTKQAASLIGISPKLLLAILIEHDVPFVNLGRGRGHGLRWPRDRVIEIFEALCCKKSNPNPVRPKLDVSSKQSFLESMHRLMERD